MLLFGICIWLVSQVRWTMMIFYLLKDLPTFITSYIKLQEWEDYHKFLFQVEFCFHSYYRWCHTSETKMGSAIITRHLKGIFVVFHAIQRVKTVSNLIPYWYLQWKSYFWWMHICDWEWLEEWKRLLISEEFSLIC